MSSKNENFAKLHAWKRTWSVSTLEESQDQQQVEMTRTIEDEESTMVWGEGETGMKRLFFPCWVPPTPPVWQEMGSM